MFSLIVDITLHGPQILIIFLVLRDSPSLSASMAVWLSKEPRPWLSGRYVASNWDVDELEAQKDEILEGDKLKFRMVI